MLPFDYNAPAELFLAKRTKSSRENYRRFATLPKQNWGVTRARPPARCSCNTGWDITAYRRVLVSAPSSQSSFACLKTDGNARHVFGGDKRQDGIFLAPREPDGALRRQT